VVRCAVIASPGFTKVSNYFLLALFGLHSWWIFTNLIVCVCMYYY